GGYSYIHDGHTVAAAIDLDIAQIANHAFYKAPLFITAGAIGHVASRSLPDLHGAFYKHKAICLTLLLAGYALAAGPGTVSFQAKELFLYAIYHASSGHPWLWLVLLMTLATAACNVAIFVRLFTTLLGLTGSIGKPADNHHDADHDDHDHHHEGGLGGALIWLPAVPLVALQYIGGLLPSIWNGLFGRFERFALYFDHGVPNLWHVITHPGVPLLASIIAIAAGIALGFSKLLRGQHTDVFDHLYPATEATSVGVGRGLFAILQNGSLRVYLVAVFAALGIGFAATVVQDPAMWAPISTQAARAFEFPLGVVLGLIIITSALILPVFRSRIIRVLVLGSCGFTVVAMYVVYQAPDLVLTQLMVEIIGVLLFVLVLRLIPEPPPESCGPQIGRAWRAVIGLSMGLVFGWMTLIAAHVQPAELLGEWFSQYSYHGPALLGLDAYERGGGGKNIVNVILVDFRGFDTMGEISVLGLAALGVWSMLPGRRKELAHERTQGPDNTSTSEANTR
ncbi:MAG: hydrogen gas-evolving membrane-bound hydrogenase subunit E, partial [Algisphaera sp.]